MHGHTILQCTGKAGEYCFPDHDQIINMTGWGVRSSHGVARSGFAGRGKLVSSTITLAPVENYEFFLNVTVLSIDRQGKTDA